MMNKTEINIIYNDLVKSGTRCRSFNWRGSKYWIKIRERFELKHILKGHPAKALKRELAGIKALKRLNNIPVPNVVYEDAKCIVTEDAGNNLQAIAFDKRIGVDKKINIFSAAGEIMALLHQQRYAHGGLALRDVCWNGTDITLIDLESFDDFIKSDRQISIDFYLFIHRWFRLFEKEKPELLAFVDAYKSNISRVQWQRSLEIPLFLEVLSKLCSLFKFQNLDMLALTRAINFLNTLKRQ